MLVAVKANRETKINENEKQLFINDGYKIIEIGEGNKQKLIHDPLKVSKSDEKAAKELEAALADVDAKSARILELESALADKEKQVEEIQAELAKATDK